MRWVLVEPFKDMVLPLQTASRVRATSRWFARLLELLRAGAAGIAATLVDLATLAALVSALHWNARAASIPALLAGGVANFLGNRHFAFRAARGSLARQAI